MANQCNICELKYTGHPIKCPRCSTILDPERANAEYISNDPIDLIYKFNDEAGLLDNGYSDERECAFPIEEALEGFSEGSLSRIYDMLQAEFNAAPILEKWNDANPRELSRNIIACINNGNYMNNVDRLDKHLDIIVYSFGSIFKLGLSAREAMEALMIVAKANMQKLGAGKDSHGKQMKPDNFISPEERLAKFFK